VSRNYREPQCSLESAKIFKHLSHNIYGKIGREGRGFLQLQIPFGSAEKPLAQCDLPL